MRRPHREYITATVDIHEAEVEISVDDLSDADIQAILDEAGKRGMCVYYDREYAERAMEALLGKRYAEATALLDRALYQYPLPNQALHLMKGLEQLPPVSPTARRR